jgi:hypothetical protein
VTTDTFAVDNIGDPEPVIVQSNCTEVTIGEDGDSPTLAWKLRRPDKTSNPRTFPPGERKTLRGVFTKGDTVAWVETVGGAGTFFRDEGGSRYD